MWSPHHAEQFSVTLSQIQNTKEKQILKYFKTIYYILNRFSIFKSNRSTFNKRLEEEAKPSQTKLKENLVEVTFVIFLRISER